MFLCDTNILGELSRPVPDPGVVAWAATTTTIALSVVTVEEIAFGLSWKPNPRVQAWVDHFLVSFCELLSVTPEISRQAGELRGQLRAKGRVRTQADMLIAATALAHRLTLVTRNTRDFEGCSIALLNPFSQEEAS